MDRRTMLFLSAGVAAGVAVGAAIARRRSRSEEDHVTVTYAGPTGRVSDALFDVPDDTIEGTVPTGDGGTLHYLERGSGRPLVLLHGITLRADVWAPQLHQLADRYRVIAVDLRGHGGSVAGTSGYGMGPLGDDVAAVLEGLDLRDAVVVGHSMGGMGLMQFCGAHPDVLGSRVAGLVFMATRAHQVVPPHLRRAAVRVAEGRQAVVDAGRPLPRPPGLGPRVVRPAFGDRPARRAVAIVADMVESMDDSALLTSARGLLDHDARIALQATATPSLVLVGSRDLLTPVGSARHLAGLLPNTRLVLFPRAGHQLMQERPDGVARAIDDLVDEIERPAEELAPVEA
jgi:non-heme chloroperoxidase